MRTACAAWFATVTLFFGTTAGAHRIDEYLQATILSLQADRVQASMRLLPGVLVAPLIIARIDSSHDGILSHDEERAYAQRVLTDLSIRIDGRDIQPLLTTWDFPSPAQMSAGLGEIHIEYTLRLPPGGPNRTLVLANHHLSPRSVYLMNVVVPEDRGIHILAQKRNEQQSLYELNYRQTAAVGAASPTPASQWVGALSGPQLLSLFELGVRHIAEGTDHLLFLLALLLPAPLLATGSRWGPAAPRRQSLLRILGIVTAFTLGHSVTLSLAAFGVVRVPEWPVEVLIAASILVSAVHALRPIFPGREARIAAVFGLVHGLAFATVLERLGLGQWARVAGIAAFNLGIEAMQLVVIAATLPSFMLLRGTKAYGMLRVGGAALAGAAALGWMIERLFEVQTPVDLIVNGLARHALWIATAGFVVSLGLRLSRNPTRAIPPIGLGAPSSETPDTV